MAREFSAYSEKFVTEPGKAANGEYSWLVRVYPYKAEKPGPLVVFTGKAKTHEDAQKAADEASVTELEKHRVKA